MVSWDSPNDKPSNGEMITRLTAVAETQAVHIEALNSRMKALRDYFCANDNEAPLCMAVGQ